MKAEIYAVIAQVVGMSSRNLELLGTLACLESPKFRDDIPHHLSYYFMLEFSRIQHLSQH